MTLLLTLAHLVGLALGVGSAIVKTTLLLKGRADASFVPVYLKVARPITRLLVTGLVLLTLSGIGWLVLGYPWSTLLTVKAVVVAALWSVGPVIDKVVEPRFQKLAPAPGESPSAETA